MKAIFKNGILKFQNQFKVFIDANGSKSSTKDATDAQWIQWGFKEVVLPAITELQKLGAFVENETEITRVVIDFTQEEIDAYNEDQLSQDISAKKELKFVRDGVENYLKLKQYLRRQLDKGNITQAQFNAVYTPIRRPLVWLNTGDWDIAKTELDAITPPTNATLLDILNTIKSKVDTYVTNNF